MKEQKITKRHNLEIGVECRERKNTANQANSLKQPLSHAEKSFAAEYNFIACHFQLLNTTKCSLCSFFHITNRTTRHIKYCGQRSPQESTKKLWVQETSIDGKLTLLLLQKRLKYVQLSIKQRYL